MTAAFLAGMIAGYGVAVPVGAIAVLIAGLTARTSLRVGAAAGLGAATADGVYALVAVLGGAALAAAITPIATPLRWVAAVVLVLLAVHTARATLPKRTGAPRPGTDGDAARSGLSTSAGAGSAAASPLDHRPPVADRDASRSGPTSAGAGSSVASPDDHRRSFADDDASRSEPVDPSARSEAAGWNGAATDAVSSDARSRDAVSPDDRAATAMTRKAIRRDAGALDTTTARKAYLGVLGLTLLNPATIVYFAALVLGRGGTGGGVWFVAGAFVASASWQLLVAGGGALVGRLLTGERGRRITALVSSLVIAVLAIGLVV